MFEKYQPYWIYQEFNTPGDRSLTNYLRYKLDYGYNYLLRRIYIKTAYGEIYYPMPKIEIIDTSSNKPKTNAPIATELISSPGNNDTGLNVDSVLPVSKTAPVASTKILNYLFPAGYNIDIRLTCPRVTELIIIQIILNGYLIPEKTIPFWKGGK